MPKTLTIEGFKKWLYLASGSAFVTLLLSDRSHALFAQNLDLCVVLF